MKLDEMFDIVEECTNLTRERLIEYYSEPHRTFHTLEHLEYILNRVENPVDTLVLAIAFHDIVYNPRSTWNEENSAALFLHSTKITSKRGKEAVVKLILDTSTHEKDTQLNKLDMSILLDSDINGLIDYEKKIFKEFQFSPLSKYIDGRLSFLEKYIGSNSYISNLCKYIKTKEYKIGIYSGSFNPFHKGHMSVLAQAENIFDKVIIARGKSLTKANNKLYLLNDMFRESCEYTALANLLETNIELTKNLNVKYFLIRGLRNISDLEYENNLKRYIEDTKIPIQFSYFTTPIELNHINSSLIRELDTLGLKHNYISN